MLDSLKQGSLSSIILKPFSDKYLIKNKRGGGGAWLYQTLVRSRMTAGRPQCQALPACPGQIKLELGQVHSERHLALLGR